MQTQCRETDAHSKNRNLLALLDRPFPLELLQDPLRAIVSNLLAPLLVLNPHADRNIDDLPRERLGGGALGGRFCLCGGFDAGEGFAEVDGGRAGGQKVGSAVEEKLEELGRRAGKGGSRERGAGTVVEEVEELCGDAERGEGGDCGCAADLSTVKALSALLDSLI